MRSIAIMGILGAALTACTTYRDVKEIKMLGFTEDVSKGKSSGQLESDDCTYSVLGYALGGHPDISRAIANARTQKKSAITDVVAGERQGSGSGVRYVNNLTVNYGGFNAGVFAKTCLETKAMGYQ